MPAILFFFLLLLLQIHWGEFPHLLLLLFHKRKEFTPRNANSFYSYMHAYNASPHRKHFFFCQSIRISNFLNFTHVGKTGALTIPIVFFGHWRMASLLWGREKGFFCVRLWRKKARETVVLILHENWQEYWWSELFETTVSTKRVGGTNWVSSVLDL